MCGVRVNTSKQRHSPHCHLSKLTPTRFDAGNVGRNRIRAAQTRTSTASRSAHRITSELSRSRSVAKSPLTNQARSSSTNQCATGTTRTPPGKPKQNRLVKTRGLGSKQSRPCPAIWMAGGIGAFAPPAFPARAGRRSVPRLAWPERHQHAIARSKSCCNRRWVARMVKRPPAESRGLRSERQTATGSPRGPDHSAAVVGCLAGHGLASCLV